MKVVAVFAVVVCASVVVAGDNDGFDTLRSKEKAEFNKKLKACFQQARWSKEKFSAQCESDPPKDYSELGVWVDLNACIWESAKVVEIGEDGGMKVNPSNASKMVEYNKQDTIIRIVKACTPLAMRNKRTHVAAWDIYKCFRELSPEAFVHFCKSFANAV